MTYSRTTVAVTKDISMMFVIFFKGQHKIAHRDLPQQEDYGVTVYVFLHCISILHDHGISFFNSLHISFMHILSIFL